MNRDEQIPSGEGRTPPDHRALADPTRSQRAAAEAAASSFRQFVPLLDGNGHGGPDGDVWSGDGGSGRDEDDPFGIAELRRSMRRAVDLYLELAERVFDLSTRSLEQALKPRLASLTGFGPAGGDGLLQLTGAPGEQTSAPIWLHNTTDVPLLPGRFRCSDLLGHDGSTIPSTLTAITPERTTIVAPGSSLAATFTVDVPADASPVVYVGHALLVPAPDVALAVRLHVVTPVR